jgi:hypothetical protein
LLEKILKAVSQGQLFLFEILISPFGGGLRGRKVTHLDPPSREES